MPLVCSICVHPEREAIDAALLARSESLRTIAERFGTSKSAVLRHRSEHLPVALVQAQEAAAQVHADDLLAQLRALQTTTLRLLGKAEAGGRLMIAATLVREARGNLELHAKLLAAIAQTEREQPPLAAQPAWLELRGLLLETLDGYPDARAAVIDMLALLHEELA